MTSFKLFHHPLHSFTNSEQIKMVCNEHVNLCFLHSPISVCLNEGLFLHHQEIAMPVELAIENLFERGSGIKFLLASTDAVLSSMRHCWDPSIFLLPLTNRFWKMTLQILARYTKAGDASFEKFSSVVFHFVVRKRYKSNRN